jgi:hypothetical protein
MIFWPDCMIGRILGVKRYFMIIEILQGINGNYYKVCNGTYYNVDTKDTVIEKLENARISGRRIRVYYGKDGNCWNDEFDTIGTIGRTTGQIKSPILIKNSRSYSGRPILTDCIVRMDVRLSPKFFTIVYLDDTIKFDMFIDTPSDMGRYVTNVYNKTKNEIYARCKTYTQAIKLRDFLNGKRWSK